MKIFRTVPLLLALVMCLSCFVFFGCDSDDSPVIFVVSANPQAEFICDADGNLLSVTALNEDANLLLSAGNFADEVGKPVAEVLPKFANMCKQAGFLNSQNNTIGVSFFDGTDNKEDVLEELQPALENYIAENMPSVTISFGGVLKDDQLKEQLKQIYQYLPKEQFDTSDYQTLAENLLSSRRQTQNLFSQELKNLFYETSTLVYRQSVIDALKAQGIAEDRQLTAAQNKYNEQLAQLQNAQKLLVAANGSYQSQLANYYKVKADLFVLNKGIAQMDEVPSALQIRQNELQADLEGVQLNLKSVEQSCRAAVEGCRDFAQAYYDLLLKVFTTVNADALNLFAEEVSASQTQSLEKLSQSFAENYSAEISAINTLWQTAYNNFLRSYQS